MYFLKSCKTNVMRFETSRAEEGSLYLFCKLLRILKIENPGNTWPSSSFMLIITKVIKKICFIFQETYRRWACSTMVPLWVEEGSEEGSEETGRSRRAPAEHAARWHARHLERVGHLDRRRGGAGGVVGRWVRAAAAGPGRPLVRLKPCLSVCQLVEQHCPYFLPADRAPAYPTQYAGEPTFLCLGQFS